MHQRMQFSVRIFHLAASIKEASPSKWMFTSERMVFLSFFDNLMKIVLEKIVEKMYLFSVM